MKNLIYSNIKKIIIFFSFVFFATCSVNAENFFIGTVEKIISEEEVSNNFFDKKLIDQVLKIKFKNQEFIIKNNGVNDLHRVKKDEKIVLQKTENNNFRIIDKYRLTVILFIFIIFISLVMLITKKRGFFSLLGLLISIFVLVIVGSQILQGRSPLFISSIGAFFIAFVTIYLAHGINMRTTLALISTIFSIILSLFLSFIFIKLTKLSGLGSEDAFYLQIGTNININLQGILMSGIIIGVLGILDDITTTQVTAIYELKKANPKINQKNLFYSGLKIGNEHILSMVNTLVLAYAGASFPLFLLFGFEKTQDLWVTLNSELIAEELIRTLVGSLTLLFAVPLSCFIAAHYYGEKK